MSAATVPCADRLGNLIGSSPLEADQMSGDLRRETLEKAILDTEQRLARLDVEVRDAHRFLEAQRSALVHRTREPSTHRSPDRFRNPSTGCSLSGCMSRRLACRRPC